MVIPESHGCFLVAVGRFQQYLVASMRIRMTSRALMIMDASPVIQSARNT